jgi:MFS family permease
MNASGGVWTRGFALLCAALFAVSANPSMINAVLALYVVHLGGTATLAGLVFFAFSLPSFCMRPVVGHWADTWSLVGVFTVGALLLGVSGLLYLIPAIAVLFIAGALRGIGWAGAMTGSYTLLAHLSPPARRGEAAGYFTSFFDASQIIFPALGLWLLTQPLGGFRTVFLVAGVLSLLSGALSHFGLVPSVRRVSEASMKSSQGGRAGRAVVIERSVLLPTALSFCLTLSQPAILSFLPLYAKHQGIHGIGLFYVVSGVASLLIRPVLGRVSDRVGQGYTLVGGFIAQMVGMALIASVGTLPVILMGGIFNAAGNAMAGASTVAVAMGMVDPERRGAGMATFTISFQSGTGLGALLSGAIIDLSGFRAMYLASIVILAGGLALTAATWEKLARATALPAPETQSAV